MADNNQAQGTDALTGVQVNPRSLDYRKKPVKEWNGVDYYYSMLHLLQGGQSAVHPLTGQLITRVQDLPKPYELVPEKSAAAQATATELEAQGNQLLRLAQIARGTVAKPADSKPAAGTTTANADAGGSSAGEGGNAESGNVATGATGVQGGAGNDK